MIVTVIIVLLTNNLAYGVIVGIILSSVFFAARVSRIEVNKITEDNKTRYSIKGPLFFASTSDFMDEFDYHEKVEEVNIDLSNTNIYDKSAVDAIDKVIMKFKKNSIKVSISGMNDASKSLVNKISNNYKDIV
jgi:SulP family sulfate permease